MTFVSETLASMPFGHALRGLFALESGMHFLNHGSFGATPLSVLAAERDWQGRLESQPVRFQAVELPQALRAAAERLAVFLGTQGGRIAFVENATDAVNAVLRSFRWEAGDEIVLANHAYPAIRHAAHFVADRHGLVVREAIIPFPLDQPEQIALAYAKAMTPRTRMVIADHVFSSLALVSPIEAIVRHCRKNKVPVLVDGAHAPGMLPLDLETLGADWYTGNCHKWLFAPKGCAFLYASPESTADLHPTVISNFHGKGFPAEFDWQGTRDYSRWLAVGSALDFIEELGVARYHRQLRNLAAEAANLLVERWGVELPAPVENFAAMVTLPLPVRGPATLEEASAWHDRLWQQLRIEVPVLAFNDRLWVRISAQIYNEISDYEILSNAFAIS